MKVLSRMFSTVSQVSLIAGFPIGWLYSMSLEISHLFADNTYEQIISLCCIVVWFEAISGLRVHLSELSASLAGEVDTTLLLGGILGCGLDSVPSSYMGIPLGG